MARIRSVKPELRTSITVSSWPLEVRYFFVLLWGYLDDYGRGVDDGLLIASDCFPRDRHITPDVVDGWLEQMAEAGPICRYEVDGRPYLHCPNWSEHQKPQHPGKPRVPPCPDDEEDAFIMWRADNPPRPQGRSRKSREGLTSVSPALFGTPERVSKGLQNGVSEALNGTVFQLPAQAATSTLEADVSAGHMQSHDILLKVSGEPHDFLTPEQGAGSREKKNSSSPKGAAIHRVDVEQACTLLADLIEKNGSKRPTITKAWRDSARLLLDKDGKTLDQVLAAIRWCQNDDFWRANVLSMPKLRKQYEQLRLKAAAEQKKAKPATQSRDQSYADRGVY